jgi:hypothetical protein
MANNRALCHDCHFSEGLNLLSRSADSEAGSGVGRVQQFQLLDTDPLNPVLKNLEVTTP